MSQNQEIIESKLCAYVDDELDADGRAEIEKHLNANPQHRRLLESLRATRDLLRWLPREQAPPELAETLNGQLERSVLLDYDGDSLKLPVWPRIFAAAAIIALTVGLGAAVFYALPRSQKPALAIRTGPLEQSGRKNLFDGSRDPADHFGFSSTSPSDLATANTGSTNLGQVEERSKELASGKDSSVAIGKGGFTASDFMDRAKKADEIPAAKPALDALRKSSDADLDQLAEQVAQNPNVLVAASSGGNAAAQTASPSANNAMVMLVRSDAPEQTEKQLTSYFQSQQVQWRQAQLPAQQLELNSRNLNSQNQIADTASENSPTIVAPAPGQEKAQLAENGADDKRRFSGGELAGKGGELKDLPGNRAPRSVALGVNGPPQTQPAQGDAQLAKREAPAPIAAGQMQYQAPSQALEQFANGQAQYNNSIGNSGNGTGNNSRYIQSTGVYVVKMSRRQAAMLCTNLSNDPNQAAQTRDVSSLAYRAADSDAVRNASTTELQLGNAGRGDAGHQLLPTTNPSLRALGEEKRALKYAAANPEGADQNLKQAIDGKLATDKASTTQPAEIESADKPTAGESSFGRPSPTLSFATTRPADSAPLAPSTQPAVAAAPTTLPSDEPVSVVILVEANPSSAASASIPATQPTNQIEQLRVPAALSQPAQNAK